MGLKKSPIFASPEMQSLRINTNPYTLLALTGQRAYISRPKDRGFTPRFGNVLFPCSAQFHFPIC